MSISGKRVAKNVSFMMASQLITWAMALLLAVILPRYLGATAIGQIAVANAIWAVILVLAGFGMDTYLTKMIARNPDLTAELVGTSLVLRLVLFIIGGALVALYLTLMQSTPEMVVVTWIIGISYLFGTFSSALSAALMGLERMEFVSVATIVGKGVHTGLALLLVFLSSNVYAIACTYSAITLCALVITLLALLRLQGLHLRVSLSQATAMLRASSPYLLSTIALTAYQQQDKLVLSTMVNAEMIGWYSTALSLFGTLMFVPMVFSAVIFPVISRSYVSAQDQMRMIVRRSLDLMFLLSVPIGFGTLAIADPLILLLYGPEFIRAGQILTVLGVVLIFTYLNTLFASLLISMDRINRFNVVMIAAVIVTVPLDLVLVPWTQHHFGNGALGGAFSFMITELGMVIAAIFLMPRGVFTWTNVRTGALSVCAGLVMLGTILWWHQDMMLLSIVIGMVVYPAAVLLLRVVPREDMELLRGMIQEGIGRLCGRKRASASVVGD